MTLCCTRWYNLKNINSHIQIPNAVLKQFRDEKDPEKKVWYLDLATGEVKRSASGKLGTEKGYYSEGIEQFWSATIESPIAALNARIRKSCDGCEGNIGDFLLSENDKTAVKRYIKAMAIRSNLAYESMMESSLTADECTEQENHDDLSRFGMEATGQFEGMLGRLDVIVLLNKTLYNLVVPRNGWYALSFCGVENVVVPISPKCAFLLYPKDYPKYSNTQFAVVDDAGYILAMNTMALKHECIYNMTFIASKSRRELDELQKNYRELRVQFEALKQ